MLYSFFSIIALKDYQFLGLDTWHWWQHQLNFPYKWLLWYLIDTVRASLVRILVANRVLTISVDSCYLI